jgi:predicted DNA-binding transcriptional regulator YafY
MAKKPSIHAYSDRTAFERLMVLMATLVRYPGVGECKIKESDKHRNALDAVRAKVLELGSEFQWPPDYPAPATLRKDLETLRDYKILDRRMYRWGYYLGTGAMTIKELQVALHALASQAQYQANPIARRVYQQVSKRLRGLDVEAQGKLFYPVRSHLNRTIVETDPEHLRGSRRDTLFAQLDRLETAILDGQAVELSRSLDLYGRDRYGSTRIWPLQLIYHDIAWYLVYEYVETGQLAVSRLNRFRNYCRFLNQQRPLTMQEQRLEAAHGLLENGWGLYLGELDEQQAELNGTLEPISVKVRFFPPVVNFILEGERRHPHQHIKLGPKDRQGEHQYVDYSLPLPERSLEEFLLWVNRYTDRAKILAPESLAQRHLQSAINLLARYSSTRDRE